MADQEQVIAAMSELGTAYAHSALGKLMANPTTDHAQRSIQQWTKILNGIDGHRLTQLVDTWIRSGEQYAPKNAGHLLALAREQSHAKSPKQDTGCKTCSGRGVVDVVYLGRGPNGEPGLGGLRQMAGMCECAALKRIQVGTEPKSLRTWREIKDSFLRNGLVDGEHFAICNPMRRSAARDAYRDIVRAHSPGMRGEGRPSQFRGVRGHQEQDRRWRQEHGIYDERGDFGDEGGA
jgi:hypothetical protein